jgi:hypothetical protein
VIVLDSTRLDAEPDFLMAAIAFETRETFRPDIRNPVSNATGLIQFLPSTAQSLHTTVNELAQITPEGQLDFVEAYFNLKNAKHLHSVADVYMAIQWPVATHSPPNCGFNERGRS